MAKGTATLDFTTTPSDEVTVQVTGQVGLVATSFVEAWFMHGDTTVDNGEDEHAEAASTILLATKVVSADSGPGNGIFEIRANCQFAYAIGTFKVRWVWNN